MVDKNMLGQSLRRQIRVLKNHRLDEFCEEIAFEAMRIQKESSNDLLFVYKDLQRLRWKLDEKLDKIDLETKKVQRAVSLSR